MVRVRPGGRLRRTLAALVLLLAVAPPAAAAAVRKPTAPDAREKAYARCESRADQVYARKCRQRCADAGGGHARENACMRKCGKPQMKAFVDACMRRAGYPGNK